MRRFVGSPRAGGIVRAQYLHRRLGGIAAALLLVFWAAPVTAEEQLTDHLVLLELLGEEAAEELIAELQFPSGATIHLVPEVPHAANWLIARLIEERLIAAGYRIVGPHASQLAATAALGSGPRAGRGAGAGGGGAASEGAQTGAQGQGAAGATGTESVEHDEAGDDLDADEDTEGQDEDEDEDQDEDQDEGVDEDQGEKDEDQDEPDQTATAADGEDQEATGGQLTPSVQTAGSNQGGAQEPGAGPPGAEVAFSFELPAEGEVLTFRVIECGITYPWSKRSWLIGPRRYGRMASVRVRASRVVQPGRMVEGVSSSDRVHLDSFPGWARPVLEGQSFPFPIEQPEGTSMRKVLEPVIVAGIVSGLVYLFYENQK